MPAQPEFARHFGTRHAGHQHDEALRQLPFAFLRELRAQPIGNDQAEHAVAEEFEPLIARSALAAMGQRAAKQGNVARLMAERVVDPGGEGGIWRHCGTP